MTRRWPAVVVLVVGELAILGCAYANGLADAMPFSSAYHSEYQGLVTFGGIFALVGVWAIARWATRRWIWRGLGATLGGACAAVIAYGLYHAQHARGGPLMIPDGFRGHLERATPFHEQLAVPMFVTLGFAVVLLGVALVMQGGNESRNGPR